MIMHTIDSTLGVADEMGIGLKCQRLARDKDRSINSVSRNGSIRVHGVGLWDRWVGIMGRIAIWMSISITRSGHHCH